VGEPIVEGEPLKRGRDLGYASEPLNSSCKHNPIAVATKGSAMVSILNVCKSIVSCCHYARLHSSTTDALLKVADVKVDRICAPSDRPKRFPVSPTVATT
jgi:hypothetical protein